MSYNQHIKNCARMVVHKVSSGKYLEMAGVARHDALNPPKMTLADLADLADLAE